MRKVLAGSRPMDLPQMLRPMAPAERADWLQLHGVPHIVQARLNPGSPVRVPFALWHVLLARAHRLHCLHLEICYLGSAGVLATLRIPCPKFLLCCNNAPILAALRLVAFSVVMQVLLINPRCRLYEAKFTAPLAALTAGLPPAPQQRAAGALLQCLKPQAVDAKAHSA